LLISNYAVGQIVPTKLKLTIKGNVIDSVTKKPLEFAAVSIMIGDSIIGGTITDIDGDFEIINLDANVYRLKIEFIGYRCKMLDSVVLSTDAFMKNIGRIMLAEDIKLQGEVVVSAEKSLMQLGLDKRVFNVEKSSLADAENATEVLRGTPGVILDKDENVNVRGKMVSIFINGKPTGLSGENQAAILKQIPANNIKSIEIMTNPSAKNAPDGGSGSIVNIVLKKNNLQGITGTFNAGIGTNALAFNENPEGLWFNKYNTGLSLNYKSRKINIFSNINLGDRKSFSLGESYRYNILPDSAYYFNSFDDNKNSSQSLWGRLGADYYINETNTLSFQVNSSPNRGKSEGLVKYDNFDADSILTGIDRRFNNNQNNSISNTYNLIYSVIFPEKDSNGAKILDKIGMIGENRELVFDLQYEDNSNSNSSFFNVKHFNNSDFEIFQNEEKQDITNLGKSYTAMLRADYTHPFSKKEMKFQSGYHLTLSEDGNDFRYLNFDTLSGEMLNDSSRSNIFKYKQQIQAVYGTFSHKWNKKWSAEYGLRLEYANVRPFLQNTGQAFPWSYFGFFPTVNIACDISETSQFGIEMGRQISRPWIWDVNPFPSFTDPRYLDIGNPYLRPSYINNIGLNYSKFIGKQSLNFSLFGSYSTGESSEITNIDSMNGVLISTPQNLGNSYRGGLDFNGNFNFLKYFSLNSSMNVYYEAKNADKIDVSLSYSTLGASSSMYFNYKSKFGLSANLGFHLWYSARDIQGRTIPNAWHWLSVTQNFMKNKLRLTISANNPFFLNRWIVYTNTEFTKGYSKSIWENRVLNLRLSYNFGKTTVKKQRTSRLEGRTGSDARGQSVPMK
jgi:hypothetical protein